MQNIGKLTARSIEHQCCGSGSGSAWIRVKMKGEKDQSDKLDPDPKCMEYEPI